MKKLPIGISTFSKIVSQDCYYVDKTQFIKKLVDEGTYYFLSRPRRFGKSLLIDTLKEAFSGSQELFTGLYLEKNWDWNNVCPVIHISFGAGVIENREILDRRIYNIIDQQAEINDLNLKYDTIPDRFMELIQRLSKKHSSGVVILIDEYDKPILDNILDKEKAVEIREGLKNFYSVIKDCDAYIKFCLLTGVSKFSKVSLFSGLNNLVDITLNKRFADICGYTEKELTSVFKDRMKGQPLPELKAWYNGYNFNGEKVYNPFDILLYLNNNNEFGNYWFETATPTFLIKLVQENQYYLPGIENLQVGGEILGSFEVENIILETLLFQTGYLTIKDIEEPLPGQRYYRLTYPNKEVKTSLNTYLLNSFTNLPAQTGNLKIDLVKSLRAGNIELFQQKLFAMFAAIPYDWYRENDLDAYEGYYASVIYASLSAFGYDLIAEDTTNRGRVDLTLFAEDKIYIFEFKINEGLQDKNIALEQLKNKKYHEKYLDQKKDIYRIGIEFSKKKRNIRNFEWDVIYHSKTAGPM